MELTMEQARLLVWLDESDYGRIERDITEQEASLVEHELRTKPIIVNDGDVRRDWRFQLGYAAGLRRRNERIEQARRKLSEQRQ